MEIGCFFFFPPAKQPRSNADNGIVHKMQLQMIGRPNAIGPIAKISILCGKCVLQTP